MLTIKEILAATGGSLLQGDPSRIIKSFSIDSRNFKRGQAFIAIKGDRFDGHHFIKEILRKSPSVVICQKINSIQNSTASVIQVKDTVKALGQIARAYRNKFSIPVIAITGSTGKTTVKEMIAAVLKTRFQVLKNTGTQNNHIGVPLTIFKLTKKHQAAVLELGTNRPGDIRWLTYIVSPDIVVLTNIGESHLERLKTPQGVFREKYDIIRYGPPKQHIIFNKDDPLLRKGICTVKNKNLHAFSVRQKSSCRASKVRVKSLKKLTFCLSRTKGAFSLKTIAHHNIYNALAAISCGRLFKIGYNNIKINISGFKLPPGRLTVKKVGSWQVIDDTYNSNPLSLRSAIQALSCVNVSGRKVLVCGDMLELGKKSVALHRQMGQYAAEMSLDAVFSLGKHSQYITQTAKKKNVHLDTAHSKSVEEVAQRLKRFLQPSDIILVKGSRGMRMEKIIDFLKQESKG